MIRLFIFPVYAIIILLAGMTAYSSAGDIPLLSVGPGCSALSDPDVDCNDLDEITCCNDVPFLGSMGKKGIQVRSNQSNDADLDGESDGIEACICDALDNNPNININPGDGSVCDSSIPAERDQFIGFLSLGLQLQGQNFEFYYTFTEFPNAICQQQLD